VLAVLLLVAFVRIEQRSPAPMLRLDLFRIPAFSASAVVAVVGMFGFLGGAYTLSIRLGVIAHLSPLAAAVPFVIVQGITPFIWPVLARLLQRVGPRPMLVAGLVSLAASHLLLRELPAADPALLPMLPALVLMGIGFGLVVCALTAAAVNAVPVSQAGMASGTTNMVRDLGQTLGPAIIGTVALGQAGTLLGASLAASGLPAAQMGVAQGVLAAGGPLALATAPLGPISTTVAPLARDALTAGYDAGLLVTAVSCLAAAVIAAIFLRGGRTPA
jgi:hypothetical protein